MPRVVGWHLDWHGVHPLLADITIAGPDVDRLPPHRVAPVDPETQGVKAGGVQPDIVWRLRILAVQVVQAQGAVAVEIETNGKGTPVYGRGVGEIL